METTTTTNQIKKPEARDAKNNGIYSGLSRLSPTPAAWNLASGANQEEDQISLFLHIPTSSAFFLEREVAEGERSTYTAEARSSTVSPLHPRLPALSSTEQDLPFVRRGELSSGDHIFWGIFSYRTVTLTWR